MDDQLPVQFKKDAGPFADAPAADEEEDDDDDA